MKTVISILLLAIFLLPKISYSNEPDIENISKEFVNLLVREDFTKAREIFTQEVANALPEDALKGIWRSIIATIGKFNRIIETKTTEYGEYRIVILDCDFEIGTLGIQITFNKELKIAGLYFLQPKFKAIYKPPPYINPDSFSEIEVTIETQGWRLPAVLTLPKTDTPCPAVVLVHGSGPQDKDETIGPNKPFKDLALGLASRGIAVLRYEKRTKHYGEKSLVKDFTVNQETVEDAISAIELLYQREEIDKNRIYLLGHSLGGMLAPRIALKTDKLNGIIMLAGTIKDLLETIIRQTKYLASLDGNIDNNEAKEIEDIEKNVERIKSLNIDKDENILGAPGSYWLDLLNYNPLEEIKKVNIPILILQGDRDYQVTVEDFELWQKELKDKPNITFKIYKGLNHLFIYGEGTPNPEEYFKAGNISQEVIEDIANWIKTNRI